MYNVLDFGAKGDGLNNDSHSIQKAIDKCFQDGGGRVILPAGKTFLSGAIVLKDNVELFIQTGACLKASPNKEDYISSRGDYLYGLINAFDSEYITVSGRGIIDGNCEAFYDIVTQNHISGKAFRPWLIHFEKCNHLTVEQIILKKSSTWTLHIVGCYDVLIEGVRILNYLNMANSDGIDIDHCQNVRISNCHIESADDCIVLKNTDFIGDYGPCENITVENCTMISTSSAVKIGTETVDDFRNIVVNNCAISRTNRALCIQLRDKGNVENVIFSNITIETRLFYPRYWGKAEPMYVTAIDRNEDTKAGRIKNIIFTNIYCKGENGIFVAGQEDNIIDGIEFHNISLELVKTSKWDAGTYDKRPKPGEGLYKMKTSAVYLENAKNICLDNVKITFDENLPDTYNGTYDIRNVENLRTENVIVNDKRKR